MKLTMLTGCLAVAGAVTLVAQSAGTTNTTNTTDTAIVTKPGPLISPRQHLEDARQALAGLSVASMPTRDQKRWSALQENFAALVSSYAEGQPEPPTWRVAFSAVERDLAWLSVSGGSLLTAADDPGLTDTPGTDAIESGTRVMLGAFRTHVELFYDTATTQDRSIVSPSSAIAVRGE